MEAIKVQYTVRPEFVEENKANIQRVMDRLRADPIEGIRYASFTLDDGNTFVHLNFFNNLPVLGGISGDEGAEGLPRGAQRERTPGTPEG